MLTIRTKAAGTGQTGFFALALDGRMERRPGGSGPYVISLTGGGGKTSLIRRLAWEGMEQGLKVFVTTTTHMAVPAAPGRFFPAADRT